MKSKRTENHNTKETDMRNDPRAAYAKESDKVDAMLTAIERKVAASDDQDPNWGHVGSMAHLAALLKEAYQFIANEEDAVPVPHK